MQNKGNRYFDSFAFFEPLFLLSTKTFLLLKILIFSSFILLSLQSSLCATPYLWGGGNGDWNVNANWNPNTGFPTSSDSATIDTGNCTVPSAFTAVTSSISVTSTGSLILTTGAEVTCPGYINISSGTTFNCNNSNIISTTSFTNFGTLLSSGSNFNVTGFRSGGTFTASGTTTITASGDVTLSGTFNHGNAATIIMTGSKTLNTSAITIYNFEIPTGSQKITLVGDLALAGELTVSAGPTLNVDINNITSAGNIINNGGVLTNVKSSISCAGFTSSGLFVATGPAALNVAGGNITIGGTFNHNNSTTLNISGPSIINCPLSLYNVNLTSGTITAASDLIIQGSLDIASGAVLSMGDFNLTVLGDISNAGGLEVNTGKVVCANFTDSGSFTATGTTYISSSGDVSITGPYNHGNNTTLYMTGTKSISATQLLYQVEILGSVTSSTVLSIEKDLILGGGCTLNMDSKDLIVAGDINNNGTLSSIAGTLKAVNFISDSYFSSSGTTNISVAGNVRINGLFSHNDSTTLVMTGPTSLTVGAGLTLYGLSIAGSSVTLASNISTANLQIADTALFSTAGYALTVAGNLITTGGIFDFTNSAINVKGNWDTGATFVTLSGSSVSFTGTTNQTITNTATPFNNLNIANTGTTPDFKVTPAGILDVNGDLLISSGVLDLTANFNLDFSGNFTINGTGDIAKGTSKVIYDGAGSKDLNANGKDLGDLNIDAGILVVKKTVSVDDVVIASGARLDIDASASTVTINLADSKSIANSGTFRLINDTNEIMLESAGTGSFVGGISFNNCKLSLSGINFVSPIATTNTNTDGITIKGNCTFAQGLTLENGSFFTQASNTTVNMNWTFDIKSGCTFTKAPSGGLIIFNSGANQALTVAGNKDLGNIEITASTDVTFKDTMTLDNLHILSSGTFSMSSQSVTGGTTLNMNNGGIVNNEGGTSSSFRVTNSSYTVTLQSAGTCTYTGSGIILNGQKLTVKNVVFNSDVSVGGTNGWLTLTGTCTFTNLQTSSGTARVYQGTNNDMYISGNLTLFTNTFNKDSGTGSVIFFGGITQTLNSVNQNTNNIGRLSVTGTGTNLSIVSNCAMDHLNVGTGANLLFNKAGGVLRFATAGGTVTNSGTIDIASATTAITLDTGAVSLAFCNAGTTNLTRVYISYCNASSGTPVTATANCINGGNNINVVFNPITWVGSGDKNYTTAANWDSLTVPVFDDVVIFDGANDCNINGATVTVASLQLKNTFTKTVSLIGANVVVNGNMTINGGTLLDDSGSSIICMNNWIKTGGTYTAGGTVVMAATSGTKVLTTGGSPFYNLILNDNIGTASFRIDDSLTVNNDLTITDGILDLNGKPARFLGNFINGGGSFSTGGTTVTFAANTATKAISLRGSNLNSVVFNDGGGNAVFSLQDAINVLADLTIIGGTLSTGSNSVTVNGNFTNNDTINTGTGTIVFNKGDVQWLTAGAGTYNSIIVTGAATELKTVTNVGSMTLKNLNVGANAKFSCWPASATNITVVTGGTITVAALGTLNLDGSIAPITFVSSGSTAFTLNRAGNVTLFRVSLKNCDASSGLNINASNECGNLGGNSNVSFGTIKWTGAGADGNFSTAANWNTGVAPLADDSIWFDNGSTSCTISADTSVSGLTVSGYTGNIYMTGGSTLTVSGNTVLASGILNCGSGKFKVTGSFSPAAGCFNAGTGVLEMGSTGDLYTNGNALSKLLISGAGTVVRLRDSMASTGVTISTNTEFKCLDNNITITTAAAGTILVNGKLTLSADAGREIKLYSGTAGSGYYLTAPGTVTVSGVDFKDTDASGGVKIVASNNCVDSGNNYNIGFNILTIMSGTGGDVVYPSDALTRFSIPAAALPTDVRVTISDFTLPSNQGIGYSVTARAFADGTEVINLNAPATISIHYPSVFTGVTAGTYTDSDVAIFYHNGIEWIKLGGVLDTVNKTVSIKTAKFGTYKAKASVRATAFALNQVVPRKNFTPNGDGINDQIKFYMENPKDNEVTAKIYNLAGEEITDLALESGGTYYYWDGKNSAGALAPSGIYIYQFRVDGKVTNGTVVLTK